MSQPGQRKKISEKISEKIVKRLSGFALLSLFALTAAMSLPMLKTKTVYDLEQFLPKGDPTLETAKKIREKYQLSEDPALAVIIARPAGKTWVDHEAALKLREVGAKLKDLEGVATVMSYANRPGAEIGDESIQAGLLTDIVPEEDWERRFQSDALMTPLLLSPDQKSALVYIELTTTDIPKMKLVFSEVHKEVEAAFPGAVVQIGGIPAIQAGFQSLLENELFRFVGFSFLATFLLIFALFRGISPIIVSLITVVVSNVCVLGTLTLLAVDLTVLTVTVPIMVTVTVMAQLVHTFFRLNERSREDWTKHIAVQRELLFPNFLANLTTAVGFATLAPSDIPMISQYGLVVGATIMISWIMASLILPPLTLLTPEPVPRAWTQFRAKLTLIVMRHCKPIVLGIGAFTAIASLGALGLNWNTRVFDDLPAGHAGRVTTEKLDQEFGGVIPLNVELTAETENFWKDPKNLERLDDRIQSLRETEGVGQVLSLVDFLKAFGENRFPKTSAGVSELMFLYTLSGPSPLKPFLSPDGKSLRLQVKVRDIPGPQMATLVNQIDRDLRADFPNVAVSATGMANHLHATNNRVSSRLILGFWEAMLAIFLVLVPVFRSVRWALVACLPNLISPAILLGMMALFQTPIKPPLALIFSISLGLAFNNTVYVFDRLQLLMKKGRKTRLLEHVFQKEIVNCLHSTLVVVAGFAVFLFAEFSVNQSFGAFMLVSILAGVVGDLIFLPALLAWKPGLLGLEKTPTLPIVEVVPQIPVMNTTTQPVRRPDMSVDLNRAASLILVALIFAVSPIAQAQTDLKGRFQKALKQFESKDESAKVKLTIIETDGSKLVREIEIQRTGGKVEQRMLARITAPSDLKGTSLLSIVTKEDENQWVYLPSSKQVRKVVAAESSDGGVLGSELRYEDFNPSVIRETEVKLLGQQELNGKKHDVLEATLPAGKSPYEKVQVWILPGKDLPMQLDYFVKGQKAKTIQFSGYKKVGAVIRPTKMAIRNLKSKRGTDIELADLKVNKGLPAQKLSVDSLAKAW